LGGTPDDSGGDGTKPAGKLRDVRLWVAAAAVLMTLMGIAIWAAARHQQAGPWPVVGGKPFESADAKVRAANPHAPWRDRITKVGPAGPSLSNTYDLVVDTDLRADSAADTQLAVQVCEAYEAASTPGTWVVVNGVKFLPVRIGIDGSTYGGKTPSKLADNRLGRPRDGPGCGKT
jgi:hypothetical protein